MKTPHIKVVKMDSGRTIDTFSHCGERRESGEPDPIKAQQEIDKMFEGHNCAPKKKTREDVEP